MNAQEILLNYFKTTGIRKDHFSKKVGCSPQYLNGVIYGQFKPQSKKFKNRVFKLTGAQF